MTTLSNKSIEKQSWEKFFISGSILRVQTATETVVVGTSIILAEDKNGADVSLTFLDDSTKVVGNDPDGDYTSNILSIRVRAGEVALSPYKVTFRMETSEGNGWEVDRIVEVIET